MRIPSRVFERLGGQAEPEGLAWECMKCGKILPTHYANGYIRGKCLSQVRENDRYNAKVQREQIRENMQERHRANCAKCYTWLDEHADLLQEMTFDNFDRELFPVPYDRMKSFAQGVGTPSSVQQKNFILYGSFGTGKTHLLCATLNLLTERNVLCRFMTGQGLFDAISAAISCKRDYQRFLDEAGNVPVLGIDDIDKIYIKLANTEENFQIKTLFAILNKRYINRLTTIITTNALDIVPYVGHAAFSRLKQHCVPLEMQGDDYRDRMIEWQ